MADLKRQEALVNEYKGNLFEFFVALQCSRFFNLESQFLSSLNDHTHQMLSQQESMLRQFYPDLLNALPVLASRLCSSLIRKIELKDCEDVFLVGKSFASESGQLYAEADVLLRNAKIGIVPVSIKLSKSKAFVNTKSGGIRSFFEKYFESEYSFIIQKKFNKFVDRAFEEFAHSMHIEAGIDFTYGFKSWEYTNLPVLPGELRDEFRPHLIEYYQKLNQEVYRNLKEIYQHERILFVQSLYSLLGFSHPDIIQATLYYKKKGNNYICDQELIEDNKRLIVKDDDDLEFVENKTNIEIKLYDKILQIRLKPMNKFTAKSFKVNCSVKN